jgi:hypothetical protein
MANTNEEQKQNTIGIVILTFYFFIPFYGLRIVLENYLKVERLEVGYVGLLGLISGLIVALNLSVLKTVKVRIIGLVIILFVVIIINLLLKY